MAPTIELLDTDLLASIFSFLSWNEVLNARVCRRWKEAASVTPVTELFVKKREIGYDLPKISLSLPRIQKVRLDFRALKEFDVADGEQAEPTVAFTGFGGMLYRPQTPVDTPPIPVDLHPLENFRDLRHLVLQRASLNGSYPYLFHFRNLQTLNLAWNTRLKWDLAMLSGLPNLKELCCPHNHNLTGNLRSVRVLRRTLVALKLCHCGEVTGSLQDVADFPLLVLLGVSATKVPAEIGAIGPNDFLSLKVLEFGNGIGGRGDLMAIKDAPSFMFARYQLLKRRPEVFKHSSWRLAADSPDFYEIHGHHSREPPFSVEFVKFGPRMGWRWTNGVAGGSCETHWLDPEPTPADKGHEDYCRELKNERRVVGFYGGFLVPPTQREHQQRCSDFFRLSYQRSW